MTKSNKATVWAALWISSPMWQTCSGNMKRKESPSPEHCYLQGSTRFKHKQPTNVLLKFKGLAFTQDFHT